MDSEPSLASRVSPASAFGLFARRRFSHALALLAIVIAVFAIAVTVNHTIFPRFTGDDDDTVYVFEAKMIAIGHGVRGTPAWLIGDELTTGLVPVAEFERLAERARQLAPPE